MTGVLIALGALLLVLAWFFWPRSRSEYEAPPTTELEAAERDVQEAPDEDSVRDWGPGAQQPPVG
jgi:Flp pilus assembly protein TadB